MKKLLTEWRKFLKEFDYDVEASVERDADFGKHADIKMKIENALDDAGQDWVLDMDDWPAETGRTAEEFQEVMKQMEASLQNNLGVSIKGLLAGELNEKYYHITDASYDDGTLAEDVEFWDDTLVEAEYQGRKVTLNKPTRGDVKKFKVYVKDPKTGNVKKVNFGDPNMKIRKSNPKARKSFRARHNCDNPGPKTKARYWSCRKW
tara:strand:+ start:283 stop:897 length:615 start_codon:yes stop_codon:yes gene_type:complete